VASNYARVIGVTLGTGFGSAFLVDGEPLLDGPGVPPNGWLYPCLFNGVRADDRFSIRGLTADLTAVGLKSSSVPAAAAAARRREPEAKAVFDQFAQDLGAFLRPWTEDFQADVVLLQGGIARSFDLLESNLVAALPVPVVAGELEAKAALLGAASSFFRPPSTP
jgi:glucokinase